jgi:hypothetical protein
MRFSNKAIKLLIIFGLALFQLSCNDENEVVKPERYLIRFVFNDAVIEFDDQASLGATTSIVNGQHMATIYGGEGEFTGITIQVFSNSAINTGTYSGFSQNEQYAQGLKFTFVYDLDNYLTDTDNPIGSLTITELTDSTFRGSFSATLIHQSSEETVTLSQGGFYIKIMD